MAIVENQRVPRTLFSSPDGLGYPHAAFHGIYLMMIYPICVLILLPTLIALTGLNVKTYSRRVAKLLFALILIGSMPCALAASFDCSKAASATEKLICGDAETSTLDDNLQKAYTGALAATDANGKKALAKEQRNWIKYTRGMCQDSGCLRQAYNDRIAVLARNEKDIQDEKSYCAKPDGYDGGVKDCGVGAQAFRDPNGRTDSFNQALVKDKQRGRIIGCQRLIDLWNGNRIGPGRGEETFGGYCVLQKDTQRQSVAICNDVMMGDFQMKPIAPGDMSDPHLINFTYNCSGG